MKRSGRGLAIATAVAAMAVSLAACGGGSGSSGTSSDGKVTLHVQAWKGGGAEPANVAEINKAFEKAHPNIAGETLAIGVKNFGGTETSTNVATTSYSQASVVFTTGAANSTASIYCWKNVGGTAAGYCDDIAVERLSTPTNLMTNPGFETGSLSPWTLSGTGSSVVASNARTGTKALQTGAASSGVEQAVGSLQSGATYLLTGWAKAANGSEQVSVGVKNFGGTETSSLASGTAYAQQPLFFTTGSTNTSATTYCYKNSGSSAGYCDDYTLIKLS